MITPEKFPYIKSIHVNDCYAYQNFDIPLFEYPDKPFSHLILTGKNGSGKSTILYNTSFFINLRADGRDYSNSLINAEAKVFNADPQKLSSRNEYIYLYLGAKRVGTVEEVQTVLRENDLDSRIISANTATYFKQYLVNKKVSQAFDQLNKNSIKIAYAEDFFNKITIILRKILEDESLDLIFQQDNFEFFMRLSDGRKITFNLLSEGHSAFLSILMILLMRVDVIRKQANNYSFDPCGIVFIDEPETHLHLQLQEQVLPLLISLFPNIQFIAATHSPAVIASIKHATIFDLTTKEVKNDEVAGHSYSDLMMTHFGLENEYSTIADSIINQVNEVLRTYEDKPLHRHTELQRIYDNSSKFLSPTLKIELELLLAQYEAKKSTVE